jgi:hypothetical protein
MAWCLVKHRDNFSFTYVWFMIILKTSMKLKLKKNAFKFIGVYLFTFTLLHHSTCCHIWFLNVFVLYSERGTQVTSAWEQNTQDNIWKKRGFEYSKRKFGVQRNEQVTQYCYCSEINGITLRRTCCWDGRNEKRIQIFKGETSWKVLHGRPKRIK